MLHSQLVTFMAVKVESLVIDRSLSFCIFFKLILHFIFNIDNNQKELFNYIIIYVYSVYCNIVKIFIYPF